jgi:hypothetical protein
MLESSRDRKGARRKDPSSLSALVGAALGCRARYRDYFRGQSSPRPRLEAQHKNVRWKDIAGIGNILRHDYQRVDASIIWKAVKDDLPPLKEALLALAESLK